MENHTSSDTDSNNHTSLRMFVGIAWFISVISAGFIGFAFGQNNTPASPVPSSRVLPAAAEQIISTPLPVEPQGSNVADNNTCEKAGIAQKWEYLTSYTVKENDNLKTIAEVELKDSTRVNEIMELNGNGPFVVGSTLYLPPPSISKSSGKLKLVSGKLVKKDSHSWQISFNGSIDGQSVIIPTFWFEDVQDKDDYKIGDCISVLFDDGFKVFQISKS